MPKRQLRPVFVSLAVLSLLFALPSQSRADSSLGTRVPLPVAAGQHLTSAQVNGILQWSPVLDYQYDGSGHTTFGGGTASTTSMLTANAPATFGASASAFTANGYLDTQVGTDHAFSVRGGIKSAGTGTITGIGGYAANNITGTGTKFLSEMRVGDILYIPNGFSGPITAISSDTKLTWGQDSGACGANQTFTILPYLLRSVAASGATAFIIDGNGRLGLGTDVPASGFSSSVGASFVAAGATFPVQFDAGSYGTTIITSNNVTGVFARSSSQSGGGGWGWGYTAGDVYGLTRQAPAFGAYGPYLWTWATTGAVTNTTNSAAAVPDTIVLQSGQTADALDIASSTKAKLFGIDQSGTLSVVGGIVPYTGTIPSGFQSLNVHGGIITGFISAAGTQVGNP